MIWTVPSVANSWLKLSRLVPVRVLDELDGPRLFTVLGDDGQLLLAYVCGEDETSQRVLIVPTSNRIVDAIERSNITLRDALTQQAVMCMVDQQHDGTLGAPAQVDFDDLPSSALPRPDTYLRPLPQPLLRVRLIGDTLKPGKIPASVVRRAVDGATGAVKTLIRHVLDVRKDTGRPAEWFRRYYDLPTTAFAFRSFEVSFGTPEQPAQQDMADDPKVLEEVSRLLNIGLEWASAAEGKEAGSSQEWAAIVEAVSHLTPPQKGLVDSVEVGGQLTRRSRQSVTLSRTASERVGFARKKLSARNPSEAVYEGLVREFDKDQLTFWLRKPDGTNLLHVSFTDDQYDDALLAFDTERVVTLFAYRASETAKEAELVSMALKGGGEQPESDSSSS